MLCSVEGILGYQVSSKNGIGGSVTDILFASDLRSARFFIVLTGGWIDKREVLMPADCVNELASAKREIHVDLTMEEILGAPSIQVSLASRRPRDLLSRERVEWFPSWLPDPLPGMAVGNEMTKRMREEPNCCDHLHSFWELTASAADIGGDKRLISDAIVHDVDWSVTGIVVSAGDERVAAVKLISSKDFLDVCWDDRLIQVRRGCQPEPFVAAAPVNPRSVVRYFDYHGQFHHAVIATESRKKGGNAQNNQ